MKDYNYSESDIQKYILNQLKEEEVVKFEKAMKENPEFALEVDTHMKIAKGIEFHGAKEFKSRIKDLYSEVRPEIMAKSGPQKSDSFGIKILLVVILLLLSAFFLYQFLSTPEEPLSPKTIYASHYQTYDWNPNVRSEESTSLDLDKALQLYDSNSFKDAGDLLQLNLNENPNNIPARLALANCHLQNDQPEKAILQLEDILGRDDLLYQEQANWYLGLAYLKMGQVKEAKEIFERMASSTNSDFYSEAKTVLQEME